MLSRLSLLRNHLTRPLPHTLRRPTSPIYGRARMASADERNSRTINTAACLIIGDEVLGGKTVDTNSAFMAKWCFSLGIRLKRVEVIEDDEEEIIEAVKRMSDNYDFVVTSGGIGPTHDDITYQSIAKAFSLPLKLHEGAYERMKKLTRPDQTRPGFSWEEASAQRTARVRMVELPTDPGRDPARQALFPRDDMWVPVAVVHGNVHVLPGVPRLFERLLDGLRPHVRARLADPAGTGNTRILVATPLGESAVAAYLADLARRAAPRGVKVGSYPRWGEATNTVTLVGRDAEFMESLVPEVIENVQGRRVAVEGEGDQAGEGLEEGEN